MNCDRCSATLSVINAVTNTGNPFTSASRIAADLCCPSTTQPGLSSSGRSGSIGITRCPKVPVRRHAFIHRLELDPLVKRDDECIR